MIEYALAWTVLIIVAFAPKLYRWWWVRRETRQFLREVCECEARRNQQED